MRKHQKPKAQGTAEKRRDSDRNTNGRFRVGNKAATATKQNHLLHGKAGADRLIKDVQLHGRRSRALTRLLTGPQPWAQAVRQWREQLVEGYGGWDVMTPASHELLSMATIMKIITDSIGDYAVKTSPVHKKGRKLYPIVESLDKLLVSQANRLEKFATLMAQAKQKREPSLDDLLSESE